jgi:hypothetical protein
VFYPISHPDPATGLSMINWIAEVHAGQHRGLEAERLVPAGRASTNSSTISRTGSGTGSTCPPDRQADSVFENPMIDRDPVPTWRDGAVALLGDAAHAMYPTGSNGGSQAIVDARVLGACMVEHGVTPDALAAFDEKLCGPISQLDPAQSRRRAVRAAQHGR